MAIDRRSFVTTAALSMGSVAFAQQAVIPPSARRHGPPVWLDMDQQELDDAYDQNVWAPNRQQILGRFAVNSEAVRKRIGAPRRFPYGPSAIEQLDVYATDRPNAPVNVFIHGGAWRGGMARDYAFHAELFRAAGAHLVVVDFINVIESGGDLTPMADQVRRAVAWVYRNARSFGGDPDRLFISGHSSGAHLAGVALTTDWRRAFDLPSDILKGGLCCSGMFDLRPVRLSARSSYVTLTDSVELALSAQRHLEHLNCPVLLAYGTLESPEFQRQSRDFATAVRAAGRSAEVLVGDACNHFEVIETIANPYGLLGRAVLEQMALA
jgi:arylformamidase